MLLFLLLFLWRRGPRKARVHRAQKRQCSLGCREYTSILRHFYLQKKKNWGVPIVAQLVTKPTSIHVDASSIPGSAQRVKDPALPWAAV